MKLIGVGPAHSESQLESQSLLFGSYIHLHLQIKKLRERRKKTEKNRSEKHGGEEHVSEKHKKNVSEKHGSREAHVANFVTIRSVLVPMSVPAVALGNSAGSSHDWPQQLLTSNKEISDS